MNESVVKVVSEHYNVSKEDVFSESKKMNSVSARHMVMYILNNDYDYSSGMLMKMFSLTRRNVFYITSKMDFLVKNNPSFRKDYMAIKEKLDGIKNETAQSKIEI